ELRGGLQRRVLCAPFAAELLAQLTGSTLGSFLSTVMFAGALPNLLGIALGKLLCLAHTIQLFTRLASRALGGFLGVLFLSDSLARLLGIALGKLLCLAHTIQLFILSPMVFHGAAHSI